MYSTTTILAKPHVVYQWLKVLSCVNRYYVDISLPPFQVFKHNVEEANRYIVDNAFKCSSEMELQFEEGIGADVAQVRNVPASEKRDSRNYQTRMGEQTSEVPIRCSYVTTSSNGMLNNEGVLNYGMLCATRQAFGMKEKPDEKTARQCMDINENGSVSEEQDHSDEDSVVDDGVVVESLNTARQDVLTTCDQFSESTESVEDVGTSAATMEMDDPRVSARSQKPINEYKQTESMDAFACMFPMVFLFGDAYDVPRNKFNALTRRHLLFQHEKVASSDKRLLGYLFDVKNRRTVCQQMSAQVKGNRKSIAKVKQLINDPEFSQRLAHAIDNPTGGDAKQLLNDILPCLTFAGRKQTYGALSSNMFLCKTMEASKRYGPPSGFFTFSFDDMNNPRAFRSSFRSMNNKCFPAVFEERNTMFGQSDEEFIQKLKDISTMQHSVSVEFPHLGQNARATHAMNDPIAYVAELKSVINDVLTVLFGVEPESFYAKSERKSSRKTRYFRFRMKGVMGYTLAFYGVVEDHQRGTLHFHLVIYGGLPPEVLQRYCHLPEIVKSIQATLDSMFHARGETSDHVRHLIHHILRDNNNLGLTTSQLDTLHYPYILKPTPLAVIPEDGRLTQEILEKETSHLMGKTNIHEHVYSVCRKGLNGFCGCRLCRPCGRCDDTHPVLLQRLTSEAAIHGLMGHQVGIVRRVATFTANNKNVRYPYQAIPVLQQSGTVVHELEDPLERPKQDLFI